jgi:hypothetical protein
MGRDIHIFLDPAEYTCVDLFGQVGRGFSRGGKPSGEYEETHYTGACRDQNDEKKHADAFDGEIFRVHFSPLLFLESEGYHGHENTGCSFHQNGKRDVSQFAFQHPGTDFSKK